MREPAPIDLDFAVGVRVTVDSAFLAASGPLLLDPCAHVSVISQPPRCASASSGDAARNVRRVGSTARKLFSQHPVFNESIKITLPPSSLQQTLAIEFDGPNGEFLGAATIPASLTTPSRQQSRRLMLGPRNASAPSDDPLLMQDLAQLQRHQVDDFGFVVLHWEVQLLPFGGIPECDGAGAASQRPSSALPAFPVGCVVKAQWLTSAAAGSDEDGGDRDGGGGGGGGNGGRGTIYTTLIDFGSDEFHEVESTAPIFVALHSAAQLRHVSFTCRMQQGQHGEATSAGVHVPLPRPVDANMNRDVQWAYPVISSAGADWGVLLVSLRLTPRPLDPAALQADAAAARRDWGRPDPDCPHGAFLPIMWESNEHVARSTERRWRAACINDARPTEQHVRHVLEVVLGRVALDPNVAQLVGAFFNKAPGSVLAEELRELMIAMAFGVEGMTVVDAARFAFVALRKEAEEAIRQADVELVLEHALLPRTLDMPRTEIARRTNDLFAGKEFVSWDEFRAHFMLNYAMWYALGVPIEHGAPVSGATPVSRRPTPATGRGAHAPGNAAGQGAAAGADRSSTEPWRSFTVRYLKTGRAFAVTAHVDDTFATVSGMLEESIGLAPARQQLSLNGRALDPQQRVGEHVGLTHLEGDLTVTERDEMITLHLVMRDKNKKWTHKMLSGDKVLKLRAHVQQKSMIPLTRIVLTIGGAPLWDRHNLEHYKLADGAVIDVSTSA